MVRMTRSKSVNKDSGNTQVETQLEVESSILVNADDRLVLILEFPGVSKIKYFSLSEANMAKIGSLLNLSFDSSSQNLPEQPKPQSVGTNYLKSHQTTSKILAHFKLRLPASEKTIKSPKRKLRKPKKQSRKNT